LNPRLDLLINEAAVRRSSHGVQRYYSRVLEHLAWPGHIGTIPPGRWSSFDRLRELLHSGHRDAILWSPCHRGPLRAWNHVITVHDCINIEYVYRNDWRREPFRKLFNSILAGAAQVVAISHATKAALLRNYRIEAEQILVIQSGRDSLLPRREYSESSQKHDRTDAPYVLLFSNTLPYKNITAACQAVAASRARSAGVALRVVGTLPELAERACRASGVRLELHDRVSDAQLTAWYQGCLFLLSPSLAEGQNLPIAEALALGANVLCSDIAAHREFYDGEVAFFDPHTVESMKAAIDAALDRPGIWLRATNALIRRSFADVAADYRNLFLAMRPGSGQTALPNS
jgi:glycosyltransferase involved in cell wall biosynthesis